MNGHFFVMNGIFLNIKTKNPVYQTGFSFNGIMILISNF